MNSLYSTNLPCPRIAFVIPCFNEEGAIAEVIQACRKNLPQAKIYVFDNNSTDNTAAIARSQGAQVMSVSFRGKGNVIRCMFADVEADIYFMIDGDATYDISEASTAVSKMINEGLDMIVGVRVEKSERGDNTYRLGHRFGNALLTSTVGWLFGRQFQDMLSGYRVFSRRYVKSFPAAAHGFETETELTVHALELRMPCMEMPVGYFERPTGTVSKLSTLRDGWRILMTIIKLFISERPLMFFSLLALVLALVSVSLVIPIVNTFLDSGLVPRLPTAILSVGIMLSALLSLFCGSLLHNVTLARQEQKRFAYLLVSGPRQLAKSL